MATLAARIDRGEGWRSLLDAISRTGSSAIASGLLSLSATKLIAVSSGPAAVALLGTVQQLRQGAVTLASLNGQAAVIQGTSALGGSKRTEFLRTSLVMIGLATLFVALAFIWMPDQIARFAGLQHESSSLVPLLVPTIVCGVVYGFAVALLGGMGDVRQLAWVQILGPGSMALFAYPLARSFSGRWVIVLITASAVSGAIGAAWATWRTRAWDVLRGPYTWWAGAHARRLLILSGSLWGSALFANWMLLVTRARILRTEGWDAAGQFDAAWAISMNQTGLILAALQTHFLPSLARMHSSERQQHLTRVLTLTAGLTACVVVALAAMKPTALQLLYSGQFTRGVQYLRWTLVGDFFKVTSWVLSTTFLATARAGVFLLTDVAAYGMFGLTAWFLSPRFGAAESGAIGFCAMYAVHTAACTLALYRTGEYRPPASMAFGWLAALGAVILGSALFWNQV